MTIWAHATSVKLPAQRAQIFHVRNGARGGGASFALASSDGRRFHVHQSVGTMRRGSDLECYEVVELRGPAGYGWMHMVAASSGPSYDALAQPIDRATCFSATPLEEMGAR